MPKLIPALLLPAVLATAVLAHDGVTNPAVMDRMNNMSRLGDEMKILSQMAKGQTAFDAETADAAVQRIAAESRRSVPLFTAPETDPKSEALPAIWTDFADFSSKARALTQAAQNTADTITTASDLGPALARLGTTCKACHDRYRK
ncbi:cytochrome c [Shimia sp. SDUM112013]|uniref:c-type cytochrome n=1 Tax=Shimia sp. SDUM112013 TaxID=3136160 RepID=UPI0032EFF550